jgi:UDP-N-acetylmuramoyl-L-alanyl-D-glutamate--2,6-diaminopimelate ligase
MLLGALLPGVRVIKMFLARYGGSAQTHDLQVTGIQYDSRRVSAGNVFVAIRGTAVDGHRFIQQAVGAGASVVVVEDESAAPDSLMLHAGVCKLVVPDARAALAAMSRNFFSDPSRSLRMVGVTGTNGKTTTSHLVRAILASAGERTGLIGTIEYRVGDEVRPATHTTPESLELNALLADMVARGCSAAVMEVSSHALSMKRVEGIRFEAAVFTNLTQDHLDFHGSMDAYLDAKRILFRTLDPSATAVTNADDSSGRAIVDGTPARVLTYGTGDGADLRATDIALGVRGSSFTLTGAGVATTVASPLTGRFNISNMLAAAGAGVALGLPWDAIRNGIASVQSVRGRFEQVPAPQGWTAVVDYAHTPDALENVLRTIRGVKSASSGRVITVFGCGGNRDAGKRPIMGRIASSMSDLTIVTSDNPRNEDPGAIIAQIVAGVVAGCDVRVEPDRRAAIRMALALARRDDIVLIAGKGHETYQIIGGTRTHFDDREEVEAFVRSAG